MEEDWHTGEFLSFGGKGWPTTDEEAEMIFPRPPKGGDKALRCFRLLRDDGKTIHEAVVETLSALAGPTPEDEDDED
jgi:hypothetical protein